MTELAYVIEHFDERFHAFRNASILLHGSREYAREILRRWGGTYSFCGIASFEPVKEEDFPGLPVAGEEDIWDLAPDMIVLTERVRYAEAAYQTLHADCRKRGIALYDMYGLDEMELHRKAAVFPLYTRMDQTAWQELLQEYDLVVFETVETAAREVHGSLEVRPVFLPLIAWMKTRGIQAAFSLRKSFPEKAQIETLRVFGDGEPFAVFPDVLPPEDSRRPFLIRRKGEDLSLRLLQEAFSGKRILYVGCGLVYEHILPQYYGIDAWRFMDQYDCLAPVLEKTVQKKPGPAEAEQRQRKIREAIDESDAVSFDVFDTLIQRRVLRPGDVFALTERRLRADGYPAEGFAERRESVQRDMPHAALQEIYDALRPLMGWTAGQAEQAAAAEIDAERAVLCPRPDGLAYLEYARSSGREIVLVSDMYFPEPVLRDLLAGCGIRGEMRVFVSCDYRKTKREGLFREVRRHCGETARIVHIGDQPESDGRCTDERIRFLYLPPVLRLAAESGWRESIRAAGSLEDSCLLGMTITETFFADPEERLHRFATGVIGPILTGYMFWLIDNLRAGSYDAVLFFARDGWLSCRLYERLREKTGAALPRPVYFYTSRHASVQLCAAEPEVIEEVVRQAKGNGLSGRDILTQVYGLAPEKILPPEKGEDLGSYVLRHAGPLSESADEAGQGLRAYVHRLGLENAECCAVSDFFASGSTQRFLQRFVPFRMEGYYAGNYKAVPDNTGGIRYFFRGECDALFRNYIELEGYFTSPEPSVDRIRKDGTAVFAGEPRDAATLEAVRAVQEQALTFAEDYFSRFGLPEEVPSAGMIERMYEVRDGQPVITMAYNDLMKKTIQARTWERGPGVSPG